MNKNNYPTIALGTSSWGKGKEIDMLLARLD